MCAPLKTLLALTVGWAAFCALLVHGHPPCVDLPAHGAQLQTLVELLRGNPEVSQVYEAHFPLGYGFYNWLVLPFAYWVNGAFAIRVALFIALMLHPLSLLALARAFRRPDWLVLVGLPLTFDVSYWYGFLSNFFAEPFVFFGIALFVRALEAPTRKRLVLLNLCAAAAMLTHLFTLVILGVALVGMAIVHRPRLAALRTIVMGFALPALLSLPRVFTIATRTVSATGPGFEYVFKAHLNWFFKYYRPEGYLAVVLPLTVTALFVVELLRRRKVEPLLPVACFLSLLALYMVTPKSLGGVLLIHIRLPVFAAALALMLVDSPLISRARWLLIALSIISVGESAWFHLRFEREVAGIEAITADAPPPGLHGYLSVDGPSLPGAHLPYLDHLGQWWTARQGGLGQDFFADADHLPVRYRPGVELPTGLLNGDAATMSRFTSVLVYGDAPLPEPMLTFHEAAHVGKWRKLVR